jgi:hypothetical protein
MKLGTLPTNAMDTYLFSDVTSLASAAEKIKRRFSTMGIPNTLRRSVFEDYDGLVVTMDSDALGVTVQHFGSTLRFRCLIALSSTNEPVCRVICTLTNLPLNPSEPFLLGTFAFNLNGMTDLPGNERGEPTNLPADADRIIAYFLHKAHRANATLYLGDEPNLSE